MHTIEHITHLSDFANVIAGSVCRHVSYMLYVHRVRGMV